MSNSERIYGLCGENKKIRKYQHKLPIESAVEKAIDECMHKGILSLTNAMFTGGDADKIPLLKDDREFLNEMLKKYNL